MNETTWKRCRALTLHGLPCKWLCSPGYDFCARHRAWRDSEETDFCRCEEGSYLGAQLVGTPVQCERCHKLLDLVSWERNQAVSAAALRRLEEAAEELYERYPDLRPTDDKP